MSNSFTRSLYHVCSPTLRRAKPSNLFTVHKQRCPDWRSDLQECGSTLERFGFGLKELSAQAGAFSKGVEQLSDGAGQLSGALKELDKAGSKLKKGFTGGVKGAKKWQRP